VRTAQPSSWIAFQVKSLKCPVSGSFGIMANLRTTARSAWFGHASSLSPITEERAGEGKRWGTTDSRPRDRALLHIYRCLIASRFKSGPLWLL